jgi:hypothetical protein
MADYANANPPYALRDFINATIGFAPGMKSR